MHQTVHGKLDLDWVQEFDWEQSGAEVSGVEKHVLTFNFSGSLRDEL